MGWVFLSDSCGVEQVHHLAWCAAELIEGSLHSCISRGGPWIAEEVIWSVHLFDRTKLLELFHRSISGLLAPRILNLADAATRSGSAARPTPLHFPLPSLLPSSIIRITALRGRG